jgi:hypothetical protein
MSSLDGVASEQRPTLAPEPLRERTPAEASPRRPVPYTGRGRVAPSPSRSGYALAAMRPCPAPLWMRPGPESTCRRAAPDTARPRCDLAPERSGYGLFPMRPGAGTLRIRTFSDATWRRNAPDTDSSQVDPVPERSRYGLFRSGSPQGRSRCVPQAARFGKCGLRSARRPGRLATGAFQSVRPGSRIGRGPYPERIGGRSHRSPTAPEADRRQVASVRVRSGSGSRVGRLPPGSPCEPLVVRRVGHGSPPARNPGGAASRRSE